MSNTAKSQAVLPLSDAPLTPPEVARRLRVSADKVRSWIMRGELRAVNVADRVGGRPRWRIALEAVEEFERRRAALSARPKGRRRREPLPKDFVRYY
jgi:excisionase family DNA binding protein